jgi:hypothetical protein
MSLMLPHEILIANVRGRVGKDGRAYVPVEEALAILRRTTGQDFGRDADAWERWIKDHLKEWEDRFIQAAEDGTLRRD